MILGAPPVSPFLEKKNFMTKYATKYIAKNHKIKTMLDDVNMVLNIS
jgi:hypothetical protein